MAVTKPPHSWFNLGNYILKTKCRRKSCQCVVNLSSTFYRRPWTGKVISIMENLYSRYHWLCVYKVSVLIRFQHVDVSSHDCSHVNEIKRNKINESFRASEKSLTTNDNSLEISPSATKFRWQSCQVPRNFTRNIAACGEISSSHKQ